MDELKKRLNIPYIKLKFYITFPNGAVLPREKVSALRGGMGEMLLQQNCVSDRNCDACIFGESCIVRMTMYTQMKQKPAFMQGNDSVGYLLECEERRTDFEPGEGMEFHLVLFGRNIAYFGQYLNAFHRLGVMGLGKGGQTYEIQKVVNEKGQAVLDKNRLNMEYYKIHTVYDLVSSKIKKMGDLSPYCRLVFHTPLCVKYQGEYIQNFSAEAIFSALFRRVMMLDYFVENYMDCPVIPEYPKVTSQDAHLCQVKRYSSTQDKHIILRGSKGSVQFECLPEEYIWYLLAGELLHIGKNTSFGFGKYRVVKRE